MKRSISLRKCELLLAAALVLSACPISAAENPDQTKIATCVACHGADGIGKADFYPNLKGQKISYTVKQLKDFRSGVRKDPAMNVIAGPLTDADILMFAEFFNQVN